MVELLVVVFAVVMAGCLILPLLARPKINHSRIKCVNNLKNVGLACRIYAADNADLFPWETKDSFGIIRPQLTNDVAFYFRSLSNELNTPKIVICPNDNRTEATNWISFGPKNISYFLSLNASELFPQSILGGDRNVTTNGVRIGPGLVRVSSNSFFGWDDTQHKLMGNTVMGDGSVHQLGNASFRKASKVFYDSTNFNELTLAVP